MIRSFPSNFRSVLLSDQLHSAKAVLTAILEDQGYSFRETLKGLFLRLALAGEVEAEYAADFAARHRGGDGLGGGDSRLRLRDCGLLDLRRSSVPRAWKESL